MSREKEFDNNGFRILYRKKCFHCKSTITINRNDRNENVIYFDEHYYHKQCFEDMACLKKKCKYCQQEIVIKEIDNSTIYYDKSYYHLDCFNELCNIKKSVKWKAARQYIDRYIEEANEIINNQLNNRKINIFNLHSQLSNTQKIINNYFLESDVDSFIKQQYDLQTLPEGLYNRHLYQIYKGTYKKLNGTAIKPEELLDMWKKKISYLNKLYSNNVVKGKTMSKEQRVPYDLAVLVSKYNNYIAWKEEQKILEVKSDIIKNDTIVSQIVNKKQNSNLDKANIKTEDDLSDLIDDMFN